MSFPVLSNFYHRLLFLLPFASESFNYDDPNLWFLDFPHCLGFKQSPISINIHKAHAISLPPLVFGFYDILLADLLHVHNNGHTIEFKVPDTIVGEKPYITGGLLQDTYEAEAVHFHWGSPTQKGSEHMLNGRRYDLEMHIVHRNTKYVNIEVARDFEDGLAVIAVLFKVVRLPHIYFPGLNEIYNTLEHLSEFNASASTTELMTLDSLMPNINRKHFFTYRGSLTTPPCSEAVTWHIFPDVVPIPYTELPKFWTLLDGRGHILKNNFRPLQSLENRNIFLRQPAHSSTETIITFK